MMTTHVLFGETMVDVDDVMQLAVMTAGAGIHVTYHNGIGVPIKGERAVADYRAYIARRFMTDAPQIITVKDGA